MDNLETEVERLTKELADEVAWREGLQMALKDVHAMAEERRLEVERLTEFIRAQGYEDIDYLLDPEGGDK